MQLTSLMKCTRWIRFASLILCCNLLMYSVSHAKFWHERIEWNAEELRKLTRFPAHPERLERQLVHQILEACNGKRAEHQRTALTVDLNLQNLAQAYAEKMLRENFFGHVAPDGTDLTDRIPARISRNYRNIGENLWTGEGDLDWNADALSKHSARNWMDSPSHREALLNPNYQQTGIGVAMANRKIYVAMLFGTLKGYGTELVSVPVDSMTFSLGDAAPALRMPVAVDTILPDSESVVDYVGQSISDSSLYNDPVIVFQSDFVENRPIFLQPALVDTQAVLSESVPISTSTSIEDLYQPAVRLEVTETQAATALAVKPSPLDIAPAMVSANIPTGIFVSESGLSDEWSVPLTAPIETGILFSLDESF